MLQDPLVRSFDNLDAATRAREALLAGGIDPGLVETQVIQDEAGPVEGNFLVGNGRGTRDDAPVAVPAGPGGPYEPNFKRTVERGVHLVIVHVSEPDTRDRVLAILQQLGGVDPQARAALAGESDRLDAP